MIMRPASQVEIDSIEIDLAEIDQVKSRPVKEASPLFMETSLDKQAKNTALRYLARRDYSRLELYQKMIAKGLQSVVVNQVLDDLQACGYQSDERFAEMFIRSRINAGDGPFKIKIALRGKGICDSLALAVIDKLKIDWFERVKVIQEKRFGPLPTEDMNEMAKQVRYLKNKGFYQDHINAVINYSH